MTICRQLRCNRRPGPLRGADARTRCGSRCAASATTRERRSGRSWTGTSGEPCGALARLSREEEGRSPHTVNGTEFQSRYDEDPSSGGRLRVVLTNYIQRAFGTDRTEVHPGTNVMSCSTQVIKTDCNAGDTFCLRRTGFGCAL